jgi:NitT/TauT family transport system ATP-binding protein
MTIDIKRPRDLDALTSDKFMHYKKTILSLIHEEAVRAAS